MIDSEWVKDASTEDLEKQAIKERKLVRELLIIGIGISVVAIISAIFVRCYTVYALVAVGFCTAGVCLFLRNNAKQVLQAIEQAKVIKEDKDG